MLIRAAKNIFDAEEIDGGSEIAASGPGIER
jgi:hypothetical protein